MARELRAATQLHTREVLGTDDVQLFDFRLKKARQIRAIRYEMTVDEFYPRPRDTRIDQRFWTVVQASLYASARKNGQHVLVQARIDWSRVQRAVGRDLRPLLAPYQTLAERMATQHVYVEDWVHVLYATVFVGPERQFI